MFSRYGNNITIDRYGNVWKDGDIIDTIPSETSTPDFLKETAASTLTADGSASSDVGTTSDISPKTADSSNLAFWLTLAVICGTVLARKCRSRMQ